GVATDDIWAVGYYYDREFFTLVEHWDGVRWSVVTSPNADPRDNFLSGIVAISATDVWAIGHSSAGPEQTLTLHWDGISWSVIPSPNGGTGKNYANNLNGITAIATDDVWAVGEFGPYTGTQTLIIHWNGIDWALIPSPNPGVHGSELGGVA